MKLEKTCNVTGWERDFKNEWCVNVKIDPLANQEYYTSPDPQLLQEWEDDIERKFKKLKEDKDALEKERNKLIKDTKKFEAEKLAIEKEKAELDERRKKLEDAEFEKSEIRELLT